MSNKMNWDDLRKSVSDHFNKEINGIIDDCVEIAKKELVDKIRARTGQIAARILQGFDFMQDQNRIIITVNFRELDKI